MGRPAKCLKSTMAEWTPASWRSREALQMASYDDQKETYDAVIAKLSKLPPLVQPAECERLKKLLAECGRGERFIIQGGDCAERFIDCEESRIKAQLEVIVHLEMTGQRGVTECLGGVGFCKTEEMLPQCYETYCDPRLNYGQSLEVALRIADELKAIFCD